MSSVWIICVLFSEFCERGREHWEAAVIKLGVRVRSGLHRGTQWAQQNTQRPNNSSYKHGSLVRCLQLIRLKLQRVKPFSSPLPNGCNLQMPGLHPQSLSLPVLGSFPKQGVRLKICPAKGLCHNLACKVISKQQRWCAKENSSDPPARDPAREVWGGFGCVPAHTKLPWCERFGGNCCPLEEHSRVCYIKPLAQEHLQKSHSRCGSSFPTHPRSAENLNLKVVCGEGTGRVA